MVLEASLALGRGGTLLPLLPSPGLHRSIGARGQGPTLWCPWLSDMTRRVFYLH